MLVSDIYVHARDDNGHVQFPVDDSIAPEAIVRRLISTKEKRMRQKRLLE